MPKIFLSYRRLDTAAITGRIFDRLVAHFGRHAIFMDVDDIPVGTDFRKHIDGVLRQCDIFLAVVGAKWLGVDLAEMPRILDETDPIRNELRTALQIELPIIPVLVDGAKMPSARELPDDLRQVAARNAAEVSSGRDFDSQIRHLIGSIDRIIAQGNKEPNSEEAATVENRADRYAAADSKESKTKSWLSYLIRNLAVPVILVMLVHYLVIMKLNLNNGYLRIAAIIIPLSAGAFLFWYDRQGPGPAFALGAAAGVISVVWMLVVVGLVDRVPIVPSTLLDWQESLEYFASIILSTLAGNLLAHLFLKSESKLRARRNSL
jgi:TIR domain